MFIDIETDYIRYYTLAALYSRSKTRITIIFLKKIKKNFSNTFPATHTTLNIFFSLHRIFVLSSSQNIIESNGMEKSNGKQKTFPLFYTNHTIDMNIRWFSSVYTVYIAIIVYNTTSIIYGWYVMRGVVNVTPCFDIWKIFEYLEH